jgi:hypothetical protein
VAHNKRMKLTGCGWSGSEAWSSVGTVPLPSCGVVLGCAPRSLSALLGENQQAEA